MFPRSSSRRPTTVALRLKPSRRHSTHRVSDKPGAVHTRGNVDTGAGRQPYIDRLRSGTVLLLVFYHTGRLFEFTGWMLKNPELSGVIDAFNSFLELWQMPLLFLLAGMAAWFSVTSRGMHGFALERVRRLVVPLIVGVVVLVPPQVYLERLARGQTTDSFLAWYPHAFEGIYPQGNLGWGTLWFLAFLFMYSMLLLPVFNRFRRRGNAIKLERLAEFLTRPGAVFLPVVPLLVLNIWLEPVYGSGDKDWVYALYYGLIFVYGFVFAGSGASREAARASFYPALVIAVAATVSILLLERDMFTAPYVLKVSLYAVACWCWLLTWVGLGMRVLNSSNRVLNYASGATMSVYLFQQTIVMALGYFAIQWDWPVWSKYLFVGVLTVAVSLALYEGMRRMPVTRFLFGIKVLGSRSQLRTLAGAD